MGKQISVTEAFERAKRNPGVNVRFSHEYTSTPEMMKIRFEWEIKAQVNRIELPEHLSGKLITREREEFAKLDRQIGTLSNLAAQIVEYYKPLRPGTDRKAYEEEVHTELCEAFLMDYRQALIDLEDEVEEEIENLQERQEQLISLMQKSE
jgi:hypothetical protein